jgi:hypothetical protein
MSSASQDIRTLGVLLGAPIFGGLLAWQLYTLSPKSWCNTAFSVAKADNAGLIQAFQACIKLQEAILGIKDHAIIGLLVVLGLGYLMMLMREFRINGEISGPLGIGGKFSNNDKLDGAEEVQGAVDKKVEEIKHDAV